MGQCYLVHAKFVAKNHKELRKAITNFIIDETFAMFPGARSVDLYDTTTLIKCILPDQGDWEVAGDGTIATCFDASYGWEPLMDRFFKEIACTLESGSYIKVEPNTGWWKNEIKNGRMIETIHDENGTTTREA